MAKQSVTRQALTAAALFLAGIAVTGCGVRGSLEAPQAAQAAGQTKSAEAGAAGENSAAKPKPHEPFVLDGLLR